VAANLFAGKTVHIVGLGFDPQDPRMQIGLRTNVVAVTHGRWTWQQVWPKSAFMGLKLPSPLLATLT
jgi:hypothetical protein